MKLFNSAICGSLIFLSASAGAEDYSALWFDPDYQKANVKTIQTCLKRSSDKQSCIGIKLTYEDLPNAGAYAINETSAWSFVGQQVYTSLLKKWPDKASFLKQSQLAWHDYVQKECQWQAESSTYSDDDQYGNHIAYYDRVAISSCINGFTQQRVVSLHVDSIY